MFKLTKRSLFFIIIFSFSPIFADNTPEVKLKGGYEFQTVFLNNNNVDAQQYVTGQRKNIGFNSSAHVNIELLNYIQDKLEYGAKVGLETTSRNDRRLASVLYFLSDYGKFEVGNDKSANAKMKITSYSVGCATAGGWDMWPNLPRDKTKTSFAPNFGNFLDAKTRVSDKAEYSRKISYFTPKLYNFQIGVSYIPDSSNAGYSTVNKPVRQHILARPLEHSFVITDGIAYGISHEGSISTDLKVKSAVVGERGKVTAYHKNGSRINTKFKNLSTYTIGSEINYKKYAIAVSYANYMKSLTASSVDKISKNSYIYGVGGRYKYNDKIAVSLNYFYSDYKKNTMSTTTLAADYKIISGVMSYGEISYYKTNAKYIDNNILNREHTKGALLALGTKIEF